MNPKIHDKNALCITKGFIDANIFENLCKKHKGLFQHVKSNMQLLKNSKYNPSLDNKNILGQNQLYSINDLRGDLQKEMVQLVSKKKHWNKSGTMKDCDAFQTAIYA